MFAEKSSIKTAPLSQWLSLLAERRPLLFDVLLVLFTAVVAVILLMQKQYSFVLYQGF